MSTARLRRIDLNLLVALDVLLQERHVTRAGERLGLSQPGISRVLERLRAAFDDPLLVRAGATMVPTPRALALAGPLREVLADTAALVWPEQFDPAKAEGHVRICATDAVTESVVAPWLNGVSRAASHLTFEILPLPAQVERALARGEADMAIDVYTAAPPGCEIRRLYEDRFACLVRRDHPIVGQRLTPRRYQALRHVAISGAGGGDWLLARELALRGITRTIAVQTPHFATAPAIVAETDWALTVTGARARHSLAHYPLALLPLGFDLPPIPLSLVWHELGGRDPLHAWLRADLVAQFTGRKLDHFQPA